MNKLMIWMKSLTWKQRLLSTWNALNSRCPLVNKPDNNCMALFYGRCWDIAKDQWVYEMCKELKKDQG